MTWDSGMSWQPYCSPQPLETCIVGELAWHHLQTCSGEGWQIETLISDPLRAVSTCGPCLAYATYQSGQSTVSRSKLRQVHMESLGHVAS